MEHDIPDDYLEEHDIWVANDGTEYKVEEMTDSHIINTVNLFGKVTLIFAGYSNIIDRYEKIKGVE
jgi:hypothetical protein